MGQASPCFEPPLTRKPVQVLRGRKPKVICTLVSASALLVQRVPLSAADAGGISHVHRQIGKIVRTEHVDPHPAKRHNKLLRRPGRGTTKHLPQSTQQQHGRDGLRLGFRVLRSPVPPLGRLLPPAAGARLDPDDFLLAGPRGVDTPSWITGSSTILLLNSGRHARPLINQLRRESCCFWRASIGPRTAPPYFAMVRLAMLSKYPPPPYMESSRTFTLWIILRS